MSTSPVIVYSTPTCHFCHLAKDFFTANKIAFEDRDVTRADHPEWKTELFEKSGRMAVPLIMIGDNKVLGFDEGEVRRLLHI